MNNERAKRDFIRWIETEISRTTGRRYRIDLNALDLQSLRDVQRLLRDLDSEKTQAINKAKFLPWRR